MPRIPTIQLRAALVAFTGGEPFGDAAVPPVAAPLVSGHQHSSSRARICGLLARVSPPPAEPGIQAGTEQGRDHAVATARSCMRREVLADQEDELAAEVTVFTDAVGGGNVGEWEGLGDRE
jgi:hypothetical protein